MLIHSASPRVLQAILLVVGLIFATVKLVISGIFAFRAGAGRPLNVLAYRPAYWASKVTPSLMFLSFMGVALLRHSKMGTYLFGISALGTALLASVVVRHRWVSNRVNS